MREGVDVEDPPGPAAGKGFAEDAHKARQDDELHPVVRQGLGDGRLKGRLAAQRLPAAHPRRGPPPCWARVMA